MNSAARLALVALGLFTFACGSSQDSEQVFADHPADTSKDAGAGDDTSDPVDDLPDASAEDDADVGETPDGDTEEPPPGIIRFVVIGDQGEGNDKQYKVGEQIKNKCDQDGCDFVLLLGDNIYDEGVTSIDDPQWQTKFELPYADINVPFYAVLGNHDYGGHDLIKGQGGIGAQWNRGPIEVEYTKVSKKWKMPATYYTLKFGGACFMMLDTNSIFWNDWRYGNQRDWYGPALASLQPCDWVFVAGHHCYLSNGKHGNAGAYEGIDTSWIGFLGDLGFFDGRHIKRFFEEIVKDSADVILAGHDHNRQWLHPAQSLGNAEVIVSGAGSKTTENKKRGNPTFFEDFEIPGFLWVKLEGKTMTGQFYDMDGNFEFERVVTKP